MNFQRVSRHRNSVETGPACKRLGELIGRAPVRPVQRGPARSRPRQEGSPFRSASLLCGNDLEVTP